MALVVNDRVKETTTTSGTNDFALSGAVAGFQTFSNGVGASNTTYYAVSNGSDWEIGLGTLSGDGLTLARTTILQSTNSDAIVDFASGTKEIFVTYPSNKAVFKDAAGDVVGLKIGTDVQAHSSVLDGTTASYTTAEATKVAHITVTGDVNLDNINTRVNALDAAVILMGGWDASAGTFPGSGTAQAGESWQVTVAGTVNSVAFSVNDRIIAILDNASTTTYANNWLKADYSDLVSSVNGATGAVDLSSTYQPLATVLTNTTASFTTAQESKLAGIESGATADQTASEILTALKTVDGAGSGLDADLLDGQSSAYYYQASNPSGYTTNTGTVTSVGGTGSYGGLTLSGTVTTSGNLTLGGTPTGTWPISVSGSSASTTGNAATATTLQTARTINGVSFNGSANITVEPYIEDDEGTAATRNIVFTDNSTAGYKRLNEDSSLTYNPSTNTLTASIFSGSLSGNATTSSSTTGNAATATVLQTARTIGGVSFNGSANINLPGVNIAGNQNTSGNAATATTATNSTQLGGVAAASYLRSDASDTYTGTMTLEGNIREQIYSLTGTAISAANGTIQYKTLSANTTFTESLSNGDSVILRLDGGATYTVTWPTMTWITSGGNVAPTLNGTKDTIVIWQENSIVFGAYVGYGA